MNCIICRSDCIYYFSKQYNEKPFSEMMKKIGKVDYYKCINCGLTISKTHKELNSSIFLKLNLEFHNYLENNKTDISQPPYLDQANLINTLLKNKIIKNDLIDYGGGHGTLSKILKKYFSVTLPVYEKYIRSNSNINYIDNLSRKYKSVINSALFEHLFERNDFEKINQIVDEKEGIMFIFTLVCENIPNDPNWFYLDPPVHTTFHTNKSMNILMKQWNYKACIYCYSARTWVLFKETNKELQDKVKSVNRELQREYLIYSDEFVDYWKGY